MSTRGTHGRGTRGRGRGRRGARAGSLTSSPMPNLETSATLATPVTKTGSHNHTAGDDYLGNPIALSNVSAQAKGKEILGGLSLRFPPKESIDVPQPLLVTSHTSSPRSHSGWFQSRFYKLDCPHFDGSDFKAGGQNSSNTLLLREYLTVTRLQMLEWAGYANSMRERFDPSMFKDPMSELVTLKHQRPQILVEGFHIAKQVECILSNSPKKVFFNESSPLARFGFAATPPAVLNKLVAPSHNGAFVQPVTTSSSCSNASRVLSKGISPSLIAERKQKGLCFWCGKQKGLCFWCGAKYHIGHKGVKAQLYQMLLESHFDAEGDDFQECSNQLEDPLVESEPS
ncbi:hypothetical protein J1N35_019414 [Gossypium stocksii]|uniref:Uncharacterized protein n=1 Tax=Gossypium stocksii TaxID=47602 RepID=A0A9D3VS40_9ROSI|nr:hypothetical protein J1N35_019414 [Gossypium stocksii]